MIVDTPIRCVFLLFFNDTATTEIYTLSLHDALPIYESRALGLHVVVVAEETHVVTGIVAVARVKLGHHPVHRPLAEERELQDRKSTRLNSSHANISYAVFCLKKKIKQTQIFYS